MRQTLETARLILGGYSESDTADLVSLIGAREVAATTLRIPHPYREEHAREFLSGARENEHGFAIRLRANGRLIGGIALSPDLNRRRAELGYWIGVPFWGNGYATEAAREVVRYGFEHIQLNRIFASHFEGNEASRRVLEKIGMRHEGRVREAAFRWGRFFDLERYAILRDEFHRG